MSRDKHQFLGFGRFNESLEDAIYCLTKAVIKAEHLQKWHGLETIPPEQIEKLKSFLDELREIDSNSFSHFLDEIPIQKDSKPETEAA